MSPHVVKIDTFEGPLEILLQMIEKRKMHIGDIALSKVADDFVAYVHSHGEFPVAEAADFVYVASTLLLIKSRSLLPGIALSDEEQVSIEDLERRLSLYARVRELSRSLQSIFGETPLYFKNVTRDTEPIFLPQEGMTTMTLRDAFAQVLQNLPRGAEKLPEVTVRKVVSLEETIETLARRVQSAIKMSFKEFSGGNKAEKVEIIVGFLAMLELVKQGILRVTQEERFADITMESDKIDTPRY